jgi:hypothetical protein
VSAKISHLPPSIMPRGLNVDQAAEYVGVSAPKFIDAVKAARYPEPIRHGKRQVWDLRAPRMSSASGRARSNCIYNRLTSSGPPDNAMARSCSGT